MLRFPFILFILSAIINGDTNELAAVNQAQSADDEIENIIATEAALINPSLDNASENEKSRIRKSFNEKICSLLKKSFDMTIDDPIEKRGLNSVQINHIIDVLVNKKNKDKNYYNFRKIYSIKNINDVDY